jgi:hypothetical protein
MLHNTFNICNFIWLFLTSIISENINKFFELSQLEYIYQYYFGLGV